MVTILITAAMVAVALWVFKLYWRDICDWSARAVRIASNVIKGVISFVKSGANVVSYLYRRMRDGGIEKQPIPAPTPIRPEDCPSDVVAALFNGDEVLVNDDVSRPVNI